VIRKTYYIENPAYLSLALDQLVIEKEGDSKITRPLNDAGQIIIDSPRVTLTAPLLQACAAHQVSVIISDEKHLPCGIWLPLSGHSLTGGRTRAQLESNKPLQKQLWQATVKAKIKNQSSVLKKWLRPHANLDRLASNVRSGDTTNTEAVAAAYYWKNLFNSGINFRRDSDGEPPNHLMNFAYAVLRSMTARYLMGAGLWPICGIHHRNMYNHLPLADDIMEPFRPFADHLILDLIEANPELSQSMGIEKQIKSQILNLPFMDTKMDGMIRPLQIALQLTCASLAKCYEESTAIHLVYPELD
jgi:CRISPR-associated protein Cas1